MNATTLSRWTPVRSDKFITFSQWVAIVLGETRSMVMQALFQKHGKKAVQALSLAMAVKSFAGVSIAAVAAFNVVADKGFSFTPTLSHDTIVAVAGGVLGLIIAAKS